MYSKKDIQKTENISHFVDKQTLKTHPFGDNKMGERAYRKAERLVAAIHLLTNHIDAQEPIRRVVRESSTGILAEILGIRDEMRTVGSLKTHSIESSVRHLISLVRILAVSGFVSFENADVLTDALDDLGAFIETSRRSVLSENIRLSRDELLDVRESIKDIKDDTSVKDVMNIKDKTMIPSNVLYERDRKAMSGINDESSAASINTARSLSNTLNRRMEGILEVLRTGTNLSIKQIGVNLPEYSEKMIQRELAELVALGHVRKLGSLRWSTYVLSSSTAFDSASAERSQVQPVQSPAQPPVQPIEQAQGK
jgi:hypothetical protein